MESLFKESSLSEIDHSFEIPLRPRSLSEFLGQNLIRERLEVLIGAAKERKEALSHCLFSGPPGLGKTTLATILATSMGTNLISASGPMLEKPGDLAGILTNLNQGDIFFIDEVHRMQRTVEEYLYSAMEDFSLDLMIDSGPSARSVQVKLNQFTLVGATTKVGLLSSPLRTRFPFTARLNYYPTAILEKILLRTASILQIRLDLESAQEIANRARGTPRIANNLLRWVRDYAQMKTENKINIQNVKKALEMLDIDERGLDELDQKILQVMIDHYDGGPVGLDTLAVAVGEEPQTVAEVYEPYLILVGFIKRTPRGREVTALGFQHMKKKLKQ